MAKKEKAIQLVTPKGILKYPRLSGDADFKFDTERGDYRTKFLLDPDGVGVQAFLTRLDKETDAAVAAMKEEHPKESKKMVRGAPYGMETDDDGNETGKIELGFGMKHKITAKKGEHAGKTFLKRPALFDSVANVLDQATIKIGGGTIAKVSFEVAPYFVASSKTAGIQKRLQAVQIIKLIEWGQKGASQFGFGEEDGETFAVNEADETPAAETEEEETDANAGDF